MAQDIVRQVRVRGSAEGLDTVATALERVAAAEGRVATAGEAMSRAQATVTRGQTSIDRALDRHLRMVDDAYRKEQLLSRSRSTFDRALEQGRITQERHTQAVGMAAAKYGTANDNLKAFGKSHELASHQVQNLRFQLQDVATSLAGGASPLTVMMQQGGQIAGVFGPGQGGVLGILRGISQAIPRGLAMGGSAAAMLGIPLIASERYQREEAENRRSVLGVGRGSGLTADDIERSAGAPYERQGGLSVSQGRDLGRSIASTGYGSVASIEQARGMFRDLSATLGEGAEDVNKRFAMLFRDPVAGADALNQRLGFLDGSTRDFIKSLAEQGRNTEAAETAMRAMTGTLGKYDQLTGATARTFDAAKGVVSDFFFTVQRGGDRTISSFGDVATSSEKAAERVIKAEQRQTEAVKAASEKQVRRIRDRAEVLSATLERGNIVARRDPLSQSIFEAQRDAGVQPPLTRRDQEAERGLSGVQRQERQRQADIIAGQVTERNTIELGKALTEQTRASTLTIEAETAAIGRNASEQERLRFVAQARIAAGQGGKAISQEIEAQILREADAYARLAQRVGEARMQDSIRFDRAQLGRTPGDAQIASQLRSAGLGSIDDAANEATASQLRLNQALAETKSIAGDSLKGLASDLRNGTSAAEAFKRVLDRIADKLTNSLIDQALAGAFGTGSGSSSSGGLLAGLFSRAASGATGAGSSTVARPQAEPSVSARSSASQVAVGSGGSVVSRSTESIATAPTWPVGRVESSPLPRISGAGGTQAALSDGDRSTLMGVGRAGGNPDLVSVARPVLPVPPDVPRGSAMFPADTFIRPGLSSANPGTSDFAEALRQRATSMREAGDGVAHGITDAGGKIQDRLGEVASGVGESGSSLTSAIGNVANSLGSGGRGSGLGSLLGGGRSGNSDTGSGADASFSDGGDSFAEFAAGGIMTSRGALPLNRYAKGGIASSPQLAMFGEGRTPEAYVPLPDGRSIPVSMNVPMPANTNAAPAGGGPITIHAPVTVPERAGGVTAEHVQAAVAEGMSKSLEHMQRNLHTMQATNRRRVA